MKIISLLSSLMLLTACSVSRPPVDVGESWLADGPGWSVRDGEIRLSPQEADSVLWSPLELPPQFRMTFRLSTEDPKPDRSELILFLHSEVPVEKRGERSLHEVFLSRRSRPDLWEGTLILNYKNDSQGPWSSIRSRGIYQDGYDIKTASRPSGTDGDSPGLDLPPWEKENQVEILFWGAYLTFRWNGVTVLDGVPLPPRETTGRWGFAHYWKNTTPLTISGLKIEPFNPE